MTENIADTPSRLIQAAFEQARGAGKADWHRMTVAVLKNRLLSLTGGRFRETAFGAQTMRDFVKLGSDVARLDNTGHLPVVEFRCEVLAELTRGGAPLGLPQESVKLRIRADLWRAILDYSRHSTFVWDPDSHQARVKLVTDDLPALPTVTEDEMRDWRRSFMDQRSQGLDPVTIEGLRAWQEQILPSKALSRQLAEAWFTELSDKILMRLRLWFAANNLPEPADLLQPLDIAKSQPRSGSDTMALRRLAIDCIKVMDDQELSELRFPPGVFLRAMRERNRREN